MYLNFQFYSFRRSVACLKGWVQRVCPPPTWRLKSWGKWWNLSFKTKFSILLRLGAIHSFLLIKLCFFFEFYMNFHFFHEPPSPLIVCLATPLWRKLSIFTTNQRNLNYRFHLLRLSFFRSDRFENELKVGYFIHIKSNMQWKGKIVSCSRL